MASLPSDAGTTVQEKAAWWFARLHSSAVTQQDHDAFTIWVEESDQNRSVYQEHVDIWEGLDDCAASEAVMDMRRDALAYIPAQEHAAPWWKYASVAASFALVFTAVATLWSPQTNDLSPPAVIAQAPVKQAETKTAKTPDAQSAATPVETVYRTSVGQRSTINLSDGSMVELNTDSLVQVNYSPSRRELILLRGEALFKVAKDKSRPFIVEADGKRVTALGTVFSVRRSAGNVQVILVEGSVTVDGPGKNGMARSSIKLVPGQQLLARPSAAFKVQPVNIRTATSWRDGRMVFDNEPLEKIIAEMNRYSSQKIIIVDDELSDLRVSGTFSVGSVDSFTAALEASFPVSAKQDKQTNRLLLKIRE